MIDGIMDGNSGWLDVLGPQIKRLTAPTANPHQYTMLLGALPPGVAVPLHSHEDRETFYVLEGAVEGYAGGEWKALHAGEVLDIAEHEPHAWRNSSAQFAKLLIVTTNRMGDFFEEIGKPASGKPQPPTPEDMAKLMEAAARYGYALASPQQNHDIGLSM